MNQGPGATSTYLSQTLGDADRAREQMLPLFIDLAENSQLNPEELEGSIDAIREMVSYSASVGRWSDTLRLVRASHRTLAQNGSWGAWGQMLQFGLEAARRIPDRSAEAWALHELGTKAMLLGEVDTARTYLQEAYEIRVELKEVLGLQATRQNLDLLFSATSIAFDPKAATPTLGGQVEPYSSGLAAPDSQKSTIQREDLQLPNGELLIETYDKMRQVFNEGELQDLCFRLKVNYEALPGQGLYDKSRELVLYCSRRGLFPELLAICQELRPAIVW